MSTYTFSLEFNVSGSERKRLVNAIAAETETTAKYLGAPTFAYQIDNILVDAQGKVTFEGMFTHDQVKEILDALADKGFVAADTAADAAPAIEAADTPSEIESAPTGETVGLTVAVPLDKVCVGNLTALLDAKGTLIKKALDIPATPIEIDEETVSFPWFEDGLHPDEVKAYTHFIAAICEMSHTLKRVVAKDKEVDNDKYAFRCFLLRLGFIGNEYKDERKILLRNLSGSSAFKSGAKAASKEV